MKQMKRSTERYFRNENQNENGILCIASFLEHDEKIITLKKSGSLYVGRVISKISQHNLKTYSCMHSPFLFIYEGEKRPKAFNGNSDNRFEISEFEECNASFNHLKKHS